MRRIKVPQKKYDEAINAAALEIYESSIVRKLCFYPDEYDSVFEYIKGTLAADIVKKIFIVSES